MSSKKDIPFSPGLPVIGHLLDYQKDRLQLLNKLRREHGHRFKLKIGPKVLTVLTAPEDIKHVMQTNMKNYYKRTNFDQLFGIGLFTTNDQEWKTQRTMVQPLFGPRYIESCVNIILESTKQRLKEHTVGSESDIYDLYARATFDIIIKTIIGIDYSDRFEELNFALNYVSDYLTKSNYLPFDLPEALSPSKKKYEKCRKLLDDIIYESIEAQKSKERRKESSMISLLLQAQEAESSNLEYDDKRVRDNIITLMFAGFETSALTLSWISSLLGKRPELQEDLYQEIKDIDLDIMKVRDFGNYPILDAVVNEAMRLYPPGWAWTRIAKAADDINGHQVEPGEIIFVSPYLTHRDVDVWEKPNEFDHTRFMDVTPGKHPPFSYFPFGGGPRICVGKQFGMIEIKLMLALIMKDFTFSSDVVPTPAPMATLRSKEGFHVKLRSRK